MNNILRIIHNVLFQYVIESIHISRHNQQILTVLNSAFIFVRAQQSFCVMQGGDSFDIWEPFWNLAL